MEKKETHVERLWDAWIQFHSWYKKLGLNERVILRFGEENLRYSQTIRSDSMPDQYIPYYEDGRGWHLHFIYASIESKSKTESSQDATLDDFIWNITCKHVIEVSPFLSKQWSHHMLGDKNKSDVIKWFEKKGYTSKDLDSIREVFDGDRHYSRRLIAIADKEHKSIRKQFFETYAICRQEIYQKFSSDYLLPYLGTALDGRNNISSIIIDYLVGMSA